MTDQTSTGPTPLPPDVEGHSHLRMGDRLLVALSRNSRFVIYACTAIVICIAWIWLGLLSASASIETGSQSLGPGVTELLALLGLQKSEFLFTLGQLCFPATVSGYSWVAFATSIAMWMLMSIAMMLPSAAPMLRSYGDIANVASRDGKLVVSVVILAAGYLSIWVAFSVAAAGFQLILSQLDPLVRFHIPVKGTLGGGILIVAGLYQFSAFKDACLEKCRNPFNVLFAKWTDQRLGVFRLGLEQGVFCLGCCWAIMLVMLVVGTMNLAWMAFFTLFAILEKSGTGKVTSAVSGGILIIWGVSLIIGTAALT